MTRTSAIRLLAIGVILMTGAVAGNLYISSKAPKGPRDLTKEREGSAFSVLYAAIGSRLDGEYVFTDQDGKRFRLNDWLDKPLIISYIFTNCPQVCPTITADLARVVAGREGSLGRDFRIVSIGFDTENDTPGAMRAFGSRFVDDFESWRFLSGDPDTIRALADRLGVIYARDQKGKWMHTFAISVVAPGGEVFEQVLGQGYSEIQIFNPIERALEKRALSGE